MYAELCGAVNLVCVNLQANKKMTENAGTWKNYVGQLCHDWKNCRKGLLAHGKLWSWILYFAAWFSRQAVLLHCRGVVLWNQPKGIRL